MNGRKLLIDAIRDSVQERLAAVRSLLLDERGFNADPPTMTLEKAVEIMNESRHRDQSSWEIPKQSICFQVFGADDEVDMLTEFEAIAIAEKYQREQARNG